MHFLDVKTILFLSIIINIICASVYFFFWAQNRKRYAGINFWALHSICQCTGMLLIGLREIIPIFASAVIGSTLLVLSAFTFLIGTQRFFKLKSNYVRGLFAFSFPFFLIVHLYFVYPHPSLQFRTINLYAYILFFCVQSMFVFLFRTNQGERALTRLPAMVVSGLCLISLLQIIFSIIFPLGDNLFQGPTPWILMVVLYQVFAILLLFSLMLMINGYNIREISKNEESWRLALEGTGDGMWDWNGPSNTIFFSKQLTSMLGYEAGEMGDTLDEWHKRIHPDDKKHVYESLNKYLNGELAYYKNEHRILCKDGLYKWVCDRGKVIEWSADKQPLRFVGTLVDISETKRMTQVLQERDDQFKKLSSSVPGMIYQFTKRLDGSYCIPFTTDAIKEMAGCSPEDVRNNFAPLVRYVDPKDLAKMIEAVEFSAKNLTLWHCEFRIQLPGQSMKWLLGKATPERSQDGSTIWYGFVTDITEQKQADKEKEEMHTQLMHSSKLASIGTLAAGVAHEINNPLAIIKGCNEIVKDQITKLGGNEKIIARLETQNNAVDRIAKIVNGLRIFARADSDLIETLDLNKTVKETLLLCEMIYVKSGLKVNTHLSSKPLLIHGNIGKLQQVILNLLSNAKDACEKTKDGGVVILETSSNATSAILKISDNGSGISKENLGKIFDPFFTTKPIGQGTGLGLPISHSIIQSFGGTLSVQSEVGVGTSVTIALPSAAAEVPKDKELRQETERRFTGNALVVDDEDELREIIVSCFASLGLSVTSTSNGSEALVILKKQAFDYVITDLTMPGMSGYELLQEAKKLPHLLKTRFIVMSGLVGSENEEASRSVHGFIQKPFDRDTVADVLEKLQFDIN